MDERSFVARVRAETTLFMIARPASGPTGGVSVLGSRPVLEPRHELALELFGRKVRVSPLQVLLHDLAARLEELEGKIQATARGLLLIRIHRLIVADGRWEYQRTAS